ncbi:MBOAT family protein [Aequorivita todarodis]|uniref:MBOAT family O-acyltransferase n=1 Tax=Aequorivita todarodis TaxID=2036821 RepID=UPI0023508267|nr:MBOAT family O-acyltransferase [Aequorivita todarodis]MDC8000099.1 MBOAT family protein [Aequorivita todarodis]
MLFNSLDFAIFLPIVFALYWTIGHKNIKWQNAFIVIASYVFYGWWDYRFLSLILFSTLVDYTIGLSLKNKKKPSTRKALLWISIIVNIGFLGFFKYYNFFIDSFIDAFSLFGHTVNANTLNIILPVGISFYTFQTLSYTIDVYRRKLEPTSDLIGFSAFVCFFPQLVAGPIERATHLLPQFHKARKFSYDSAIDGLRQILWGLFKKMVIADNCARFANEIFNNYGEYSASTLFMGAVFFAFQIYGDFSGYSDIAIGTSRLFGFDLRQNFAYPYFSRDMAEFWRRWHISLSTWFRDYVYIPLGGSKGTKWIQIRNVFIVFIVSGFWHGANWTFLAWGALNALYFLPLLIFNKNRSHLNIVARNKLLPSIKEMSSIIFTFLLTVFAWIFFRSENLSHAFNYIEGLTSFDLFTLPEYIIRKKVYPTVLLLVFFFIVEWLGRNHKYAIEGIKEKTSLVARWGFYAFVIFLIGMYMETDESPFIYFQF